MEIIDLTDEICSKVKLYPGDPKVELKLVHSLKKQGWRLRKLSFGSHTGTHVDAFSHMVKNGKPLSKIPLDRFFGPAKLVKISDKFPFKIGLVFASGKLIAPLFDKIVESGAPFIAVSTGCCFSVDLERKLLKHGVITFTDLINVDQLPEGRTFMFYGFPLKIKNGDGSPVRAVAILSN